MEYLGLDLVYNKEYSPINMYFRTPILVTIFLNFYLPNNNGTLSLDSPILLRLTHSDPPKIKGTLL
jgi:hypothetical protein